MPFLRQQLLTIAVIRQVGVCVISAGYVYHLSFCFYSRLPMLPGGGGYSGFSRLSYAFVVLRAAVFG